MIIYEKCNWMIYVQQVQGLILGIESLHLLKRWHTSIQHFNTTCDLCVVCGKVHVSKLSHCKKAIIEAVNLKLWQLQTCILQSFSTIKMQRISDDLRNNVWNALQMLMFKFLCFVRVLRHDMPSYLKSDNFEPVRRETSLLIENNSSIW